MIRASRCETFLRGKFLIEYWRMKGPFNRKKQEDIVWCLMEQSNYEETTNREIVADHRESVSESQKAFNLR